MNFFVSQPSGEGIYIERMTKDVRFGRFAANGELSHIRYRYEKPRSPEIVSQHQPPFVAEIFRGDGDKQISVCPAIVTAFQIDRQIWAYAELVSREDFLFNCQELVKYNPGEVAEIAADRQKLYRVSFGRGERTLQNIVEEFYFGLLPPEVASIQDERAGLNGLAKWVVDLLIRESDDELKKLTAEGNARAAEQLANFPRREDHEPANVDHYKNRTEVQVRLLRKEWPEFFAAMDGLKMAKTEIELADWRKRVVIGYQADHKALFGTIPEARQTDAAEFSRDDYYIRLMNEAMNAPKCRALQKIYWQLVGGWIEKNYYQMNENQLGTAFNRDWNYARPYKGGTLARYARKIGLQSTLKRGRKPRRKS